MSGFHAPDAEDPVAASVSLRVPNEVAAAAATMGGLVLVDEEGAPVASLEAPTASRASETEQWLSGTVAGADRPASGPFHRLQLSATGPGEERQPGVMVERPLLAEEIEQCRSLAADRGGFTILVRSVEPVVPVDVLLKSVLAAAAQIPHARVVALPLAHRDDLEVDASLSRMVAANYRVDLVEIGSDVGPWTAVRRLLDSDAEGLEDLLDPATLSVLRNWRPKRAQRGLTLFFTGLSGSGKSTVARGVIDRLQETSRTITSVDGDVARRMLSAGLTFSRSDRDLNIRRIGWVAAEVTRHGGVAVCAPIAPFAATRADVRAMVESNGDFVLVHISTPLEECERRDRKGLYAKARRGEIPDFTGISSPYEEPVDADLVIDTTDISVSDAVEMVLQHLADMGWVSPPDPTD